MKRAVARQGMSLLLVAAGVAGMAKGWEPVRAQEGGSVPAQPPPAASGEMPAPKPPDTYTYSPEGRRDPFISLIARGGEGRTPDKRPSGIKGLSVAEVALRGIVRSQGNFMAILQSPDNRTYLAHPGDQLLDGNVKAIAIDEVIFLQEVNDPLSVVKQREVRKPLRRSEVVER